MKKSLLSFYGGPQLDTPTLQPAGVAYRAGQITRLLGLALSLLLTTILFVACSNPFGGANTSATPTTQQVLNKIGWCTTPTMVFRDEGAITPTVTVTPTVTATATSTNTTPTAGPGTPSTVTSWPLVQSKLGFTVYLPATLARGSCLVSAQATIHDPIYGGEGSFTIGYLLPDHTSLSISETPLLKSLNTAFQCNSSSATTPTSSSTPATTPTASTPLSQLCSGAKNTTSIVIAGPGTVAHVQQIFESLQPNVTWIPIT